jgi:tight adherence protein B
MTTLLVLVFIVLVVVTLSVMLAVTKPTKKETDLGKRLAGFEKDIAGERDIDPDILRREVYSEYPVLDAILQRIKLASDLDTLIRQADVRWTVGRVLFGALVLFAAGGVFGAVVLHNYELGVVVGLVAGVAPYFYLRFKRQGRLNRFTAVLPDAIDLMARALRAGHAVTAAIEMVAREIGDPVGPEFRRVFEEQNFGLPLREGLLNLAKRVPVDDLQFLVTAMLVQKETGGNLAEVLDKAGVVIRERSRLQGQLRIYTAQGRLTGWILGLLPFILFMLLDFISPNYMHIMLDDPLGRKWIWIGLALMSIGIYMIRRIVDIKV